MVLPPDCSLEAFLAKYEQVRNADMSVERVPAARGQTLWWITRGSTEQVTLIDLTPASDAGGGWVRSVLRFEKLNGLGHVTPVLLLDSGTGFPDTSSVAGNGELLSILQTARTQKAVSAQQWEVQRLVTLVRRRLWTESQWRRNQGKDQDHE
jgi:hypothetical protein